MLGLDEGCGLGEVVDDESGLGIALVHRGQGGESLLAGCVPDLKLDGSRWQVAFLGEEGGADGGLLVFLEVVVYESEDERRLSDGL